MIKQLILRWARNRTPDFLIGGKDSPYLRRHWLLPRNRFFNIYVHEFLRSDDDRALHTHPWALNMSWLIDGEYIEHTPAGSFRRRTGQFKVRLGAAPHRVELLDGPWSKIVKVDGEQVMVPSSKPCWTVFITGPRVREWGFHCPKGWVPWQVFCDTEDKGNVGKGCPI